MCQIETVAKRETCGKFHTLQSDLTAESLNLGIKSHKKPDSSILPRWASLFRNSLKLYTIPLVLAEKCPYANTTSSTSEFRL